MGTRAATRAAVTEAVKGARALGFNGRSPHLSRELPGGTLHLVHVQQVVAGATGRDPGFPVNLNVVHGALRRAWHGAGTWQSKQPVRSGVNVGLSERLGFLAYGYDHWWHPGDEGAAHLVATEVVELLRTKGVEWLEEWSDPGAVLERLPSQHAVLPTVELVAALLVERPGYHRRASAAVALRTWWSRLQPELDAPSPAKPSVDDDTRIVAWLLSHLSDV